MISWSGGEAGTAALGRQRAVEPRYVGFEIADEFVVGYGLDHDDLHRNLPYVGTLPPRRPPADG